MNVVGRYNFYKNDELIVQSPNLITSNGRNMILQYLVGGLFDWASYIGIGAFNTTASLSDYKLYYELLRVPILARVPIDSTTTLLTGSGTASNNYVVVSSSSAVKTGYSISGAGLNSSETVTVTGISGASLTISHPVQSTFSGSSLTINSAKSIKFRSRLGPEVACRIYEIGTFNTDKSIAATTFDSRILTNFDDGTDVAGWSSGSAVTISSDSIYQPRAGSSMLALTATASSSASAVLGDSSVAIYKIGTSSSNYGSLNISTVGYSSSYDTAKLLVYTSNSNASVTVKAQDNTTGNTTNYITLIQKTAITSGSPTLIETEILKNTTFNDVMSKIEVLIETGSSSATVYLDSLKLSNKEDVSIYTGMASRSVLPTPIVKDVGETIEIEYEVFLFP